MHINVCKVRHFPNEGEQIGRIGREAGSRQPGLLEDERTFDGAEAGR